MSKLIAEVLGADTGPPRKGMLVEVLDTTLRDGQQDVGIDFSVKGKLRVAKEIGSRLPVVSVIEVGWPGANPTDTEACKLAKTRPFHHKLAAFGMTRRPHTKVEDDGQIQNLVDAGTPIVTIVGKSHIDHVRLILRTTEHENLRMIEDSVGYIASQGGRVIYDAEHFFDGATRDLSYAVETLYAAARGGADTVVLCDTNGGHLPATIAKYVGHVVNDARLHALYQHAHNLCNFATIRVGVHTHDDRRHANANTVAAVEAGATHVQGTIAGIGERVGNADLFCLLDVLSNEGYVTLSGDHSKHFTLLAEVVAEEGGKTLDPSTPYVGGYAFATKAGLHQRGVLIQPRLYEYMDPAVFGNRRQFFVSSQSGTEVIKYHMEQAGLPWTDSVCAGVIDTVKEKEYSGYRYAHADASVQLLERRLAPGYEAPFAIRETCDIQNNAHRIEISRPTEHGSDRLHVGLTNDNPRSVFESVKDALSAGQEELRELACASYQLQQDDGCYRALVTTADGHTSWTTVGVGSSPLLATVEAVMDSLEYAVCHARGHTGHE